MFEGSWEILKIREKKEKHTWSVQVMNKLLNGAYEYEDRGMNPLQAAQLYLTEDETMPYKVSDSGGGVKFGSIVEEQMMTPRRTTDHHQDDNKGNDSKKKIAEGNSLLSLYIYMHK